MEEESSEKEEDEEDKCPRGFEYNSVLNVCDDVDEVNSQCQSINSALKLKSGFEHKIPVFLKKFIHNFAHF